MPVFNSFERRPISVSLHPKTKRFSLEKAKFAEEQIAKLPKTLEELSLCNCTFDAPLDILRFTKLKTLKLINCNLSKLPKLPKTLEHLYISKNPFSKIPTEIFSLKKLQTLVISSCPFTTIPSQFKKLSSLRYLSLQNSSVTKGLDIIAKLPKLERFRFGCHDLQSGTALLPPGFSALKHFHAGHDVLLSKDAFVNHHLETLDVHLASTETAEHLLRSFGSYKRLIGAPYGILATPSIPPKDLDATQEGEKKRIFREWFSSTATGSSLPNAFTQGLVEFHKR